MGELPELTAPLLHTRPKPGILEGNLNSGYGFALEIYSLGGKVDVGEKLILSSRQTKCSSALMLGSWEWVTPAQLLPVQPGMVS